MIIKIPMSRPVSRKTRQIFEELRERLRSGLFPDDRSFYSNRGLSHHFAISYQTAHRILEKLAAEGLILRRPGSGSLVVGQPEVLRRTALVFSPRADRGGTFGHHLRECLEAELNRRRIPHYRLAADRADRPKPEDYPVFWNIGPLPAGLLHLKRPCLLLNERPPWGIGARWVDTVGVDDYSGGVIAGELLRNHRRCRNVLAVAGPAGDLRSRERIRGFQSIFPDARVLPAGTWGSRIPAALLAGLRRSTGDGIFCVNDRLAVRVFLETSWKGSPPFLIGFDNSPASRDHHLSTVGIPWEELSARVADVIQRRLAQDRKPATDVILRLEPILRQ